MVRYEVSVITTLLGRQQKIETLKEIVGYFLKNGHNVRQVQSLGDRCLPYAMRTPTENRVSEGSYFLLDTDFRIKDMDEIKHKLKHIDNVMKVSYVDYDQVYNNDETECEGRPEIDFMAKLDELKKKPASPFKKRFDATKVTQGVPFPTQITQ